MNSAERVLMLNNEFPPLGGGSGIVNKRILGECASPSLGIDLITSCTEGKSHIVQEGDSARIFYERISKKNIHHFTIAEFLRYCIAAYRRASTLWGSNTYSVLFAWNAIPVGFLAFILAKKYKVPYIIRMAGPDIPGWESRYNVLHFFMKPLLLCVIRNASAIVVKCEREAVAIRRYSGSTPVQVIHNGVTLPAALPHRERSAELRLISVGRLIPLKHQDDMIRAVHALYESGRRVSLCIVGDGDVRDQYVQLARQLGAETYVQFVGQVSHADVAKYYTEADAFVMASENEAMSNAMLEAMAYGLPVLTTPVGGSEELLQHGTNGLLFEHRSVAQLAEHIARLIDSPALLEQMGKAAYATAQQFSAAKSNELYTKLLCSYKSA